MSAATSVATRPRGRVERLYDLLDRTDYRVAVDDYDRDEIFKLRYDAYVRANGILPNFSKRLSDHFDDLDNTTIFGLHVDGELATTIRISVATAEYSDFPAMEVFPHLLEPELAAGKTIIDPTRHATRDSFSRANPSLLPFMTTRVPWLAADYYDADIILAAVRPEHTAFYERVFGCYIVGDPAYYPELMSPHYLMFCDYRAMRDKVHQNHPIFRSTAFERRMLIEQQGLTPSPRLAEPAQMNAPVRPHAVSGGDNSDAVSAIHI